MISLLHPTPHFSSTAARERDQVVWPISGQFFPEHAISAEFHPSYRHEEPASPTTCVTLSRNHSKRSCNFGFDELQTQLRGALLEQEHLLLAVSRFVVIQALIDVLVSPFQQAIDQTGELVRHRGDRLRRTESGAK